MEATRTAAQARYVCALSGGARPACALVHEGARDLCSRVALSPLDLIPDFIPIVGYLDDLIVVPLGIALVLRLTPPNVLADCRQRAQVLMDNGTAARSLPARIATATIVIIWLLGLALAVTLVLRALWR